MDSSELAHIFDAITGGTCAERFLSTLAGDSLADPALATQDLPIPTPAFDMPVVAAQASLPLDSFPPTSSPIPPQLVSHPFTDTPFLLPEYSLPGSAITGSYRSNTNSAVRDTTIQKKKRTRSHRLKKEAMPVLGITASAPNVSFASDISAVTPDDVSPSHTTREVPPKPEPCIPPDRLPGSNPQTITTACSLSANALHGPTNLSPSRSKSAASPVAPTAPKSHTRKCREKVTRQFENLLEVLPSPPRGVEVKHKAQILGYTIKIFKDLLLRRTSLQAEIVLASKPALMQWMSTAIASAAACMKREARIEPVPLSAVLEPFAGLYCVKQKWTYGELWLVDPDKQQASLSSCVFNSEDNDILQRLKGFATESRNRFQVPSRLDSGMISRAMACHRPEWLEQPASDPAVFCRADVASSHGICLVETVPIVLAKNRCSAVLLFADVKPHKFSTTDMSVANEYAEVISEGYMQYLQRMRHRCAAVHVDGRIQAKPICSAETKPDLSDHLMSPEGCLGSMNGGRPGMTNGIIPQTETSSRFFADSDLMAGRCL